jgi:hypothetical protein
MARIRAHLVVDDTQQRSFTAPVWTNQAYSVAGIYSKCNVSKERIEGERLRELMNGKHSHLLIVATIYQSRRRRLFE